MKTLKYSEASKGMRVVLTNPDSGYTIGKNNPEVGTIWECDGVIYSCTGSTINVSWNNGNSNSYKSGELSEIHDSSLCEGRCKSIW
jgi:Mib_herc2.